MTVGRIFGKIYIFVLGFFLKIGKTLVSHHDDPDVKDDPLTRFYVWFVPVICSVQFVKHCYCRTCAY